MTTPPDPTPAPTPAPTPTPIPAPKSGLLSSEFWLTIITHVAWVITLIFHRNLSPYVPAVAIGVAALTTIVYTISRAHLKWPHSRADWELDERRILAVVGPIVAEVKSAVEAITAVLPHLRRPSPSTKSKS